jgi:hypothetical protein
MRRPTRGPCGSLGSSRSTSIHLWRAIVDEVERPLREFDQAQRPD